MLTVFDNIPARERIIVALDCGIEEAFDLADKLQGKAVWMKVGMTLFYANGPAIVYALKERGFKVFLDLKFHDIPHQVEGAAYSAAASGADMLTMHTVGGVDMMMAAQRGAEQSAAEYGHEVPATLGITVLTSMNDAALAETGVSRSMADQVVVLAEQAKRSGISGVVASPKEAARLREILGPEAYIVTPGVRPAGADKGDQSRVATPADAFAAGASHIVVGRPITQAADPAAAFEAIAAELA
ncbi:orotidine-5'-phosphate decarboxylase [Adlercreutzia sp. ZJ138]|uniref:orotidine-5'-phosphate decarboxylase n=1 Tax=Adlercreutzia sp. ZJ138 TaxID=2709405 RepID=UPI0013EBBE25|nr:orotidine-5'-phosphate decarboxylase [Adlercreutzia sp. ZJ138]